jgi:hypothetical protein
MPTNTAEMTKIPQLLSRTNPRRQSTLPSFALSHHLRLQRITNVGTQGVNNPTGPGQLNYEGPEYLL